MGWFGGMGLGLYFSLVEKKSKEKHGLKPAEPFLEA